MVVRQKSGVCGGGGGGEHDDNDRNDC